MNRALAITIIALLCFIDLSRGAPVSERQPKQHLTDVQGHPSAQVRGSDLQPFSQGELSSNQHKEQIKSVPSIRELIKALPAKLTGKKRKEWQEVFDNHPSIVGLDMTKEADSLESDIRSLRPDIQKEKDDNRKFTAAIKNHFRHRKVPKSKQNLIMMKWESYLTSLRQARHYAKLTHPINDEGYKRLTRRKNNKQEWEVNGKGRLSNKFWPREAVIEGLTNELIAAKLSPSLGIDEMERATRSSLDKCDDAGASIEALRRYLKSHKQSEKYISAVIGLRRSARVKESKRKSDSRRALIKKGEGEVVNAHRQNGILDYGASSSKGSHSALPTAFKAVDQQYGVDPSMPPLGVAKPGQFEQGDWWRENY